MKGEIDHEGVAKYVGIVILVFIFTSIIALANDNKILSIFSLTLLFGMLAIAFVMVGIQLGEAIKLCYRDRGC